MGSFLVRDCGDSSNAGVPLSRAIGKASALWPRKKDVSSCAALNIRPTATFRSDRASPSSLHPPAHHPKLLPAAWGGMGSGQRFGSPGHRRVTTSRLGSPGIGRCAGNPGMEGDDCAYPAQLIPGYPGGPVGRTGGLDSACCLGYVVPSRAGKGQPRDTPAGGAQLPRPPETPVQFDLDHRQLRPGAAAAFASAAAFGIRQATAEARSRMLKTAAILPPLKGCPLLLDPAGPGHRSLFMRALLPSLS